VTQIQCELGCGFLRVRGPQRAAPAEARVGLRQRVLRGEQQLRTRKTGAASGNLSFNAIEEIDL